MGTTRLNRWALGALLHRSHFETRSALARAAMVAPATISYVLSGERDASPEVLAALAAALEVPVQAISCDPHGELGQFQAVVQSAVDELRGLL